MSWIEKLYQTYENNPGNIANPNDAVPLLPLFHSTQNAQLHVVLDSEGNLVDASVVTKDDAPTIIPATEGSAGRAGAKIAPHALFDTLQYVAGDYLEYGGNPNKKKNESGFEPYIQALQGWVENSGNRKLQSVFTYLKKGHLIKDLIEKTVLVAGNNGMLAEEWTEPTDAPPIFKVIKQSNKKGQFEAFVRFSVEIPGDNPSELWKDSKLRESWGSYYATLQSKSDLCMVTGEMTNVASNHPKNIRYPGDGAKLVSSNDTEGFTYLGRFTTDAEACCIGIEVTQKAHSALRWLIERQGRRDGDQAVVAWAVSGAEVPDPQADTFSFLFGREQASTPPKTGYTAQEVGAALSKKIAGYAAKLKSADEVLVFGLDSATPGRMAISYYRELTGSEFLERIEAWHTGCCWQQYFGKDRVFYGAPAPRDIAETAFGTWREGKMYVDEKLRRATVERLLPCIVDGALIPRDLMESCVRRASSRNGIENWGWEKALGIACALFRYHHKERSYSMALDRELRSRDYLYGRLLALAEHLEERALYVGGEKRSTSAEKLMQRFADRPYSTWRILETGLTPYKVRLNSRRRGFLNAVQQEIDSVCVLFETDNFTSDKRLSGEFLLGYHCQRAALKPVVGQDAPDEADETINSED
ncbi:type I-C CRISPR-associated protein Cas8c/Csd1 [Geobacter sp.]|uniref:type I-C CRISPR-associated protein Cas8c/Csd1 n=1 Tax=Geobacter sp. TaxID=46610 RepID=UPI002634AB39|nr:type I-C CRISPR-associated protein Cas8c/Csd1 [Geobacter sp.]